MACWMPESSLNHSTISLAEAEKGSPRSLSHPVCIARGLGGPFA